MSAVDFDHGDDFVVPSEYRPGGRTRRLEVLV